MVLVSVFETAGSTYSKTGAHMLIDATGVFRGMLSGGCLEGDLAIRAQVVIDSGVPQVVTYDLGADDDELWGLGVGCDGLMRMFLQPLTAAQGYQPFAAIAETLAGAPPSVVAVIIEPGSPRIRAGAGVIIAAERKTCMGIEASDAEAIGKAAKAALAAGTSRTLRVESDGASHLVLVSVIVPPPRVLVLGAGLDAEPLVRFCNELGWRATIVDHRQAYIDNNDFSGAEAALCIPAAELHQTIDLADFDLAIVMSHHLASDRAYLRQLAGTAIGYIGLLGPRERRDRLLAELGTDADKIRGRLHGPAGLDIGGRGPAPIALSIVAEMHRAMHPPAESPEEIRR